jgi:hypothetical protein
MEYVERKGKINELDLRGGGEKLKDQISKRIRNFFVHT